MIITPKRLYFILMAVVGLLIIGLLVGTLNVNSLLSKRSDNLVSLKAKSQALDQEHASLAGAKKSIAKYSGLEKITKSIVPEDKDQAEAVRQIVNIAAANNVSLASISFPASTLGNTTVVPSTGAATSTPAPAVNPKSPAVALSQLQTVPSIPGVYQLSINITGDPNKSVPFTSLINFLSDLEHNRRTAQISALTIAPDSSNRSLLTFTLSLNEYIKP